MLYINTIKYYFMFSCKYHMLSYVLCSTVSNFEISSSSTCNTCWLYKYLKCYENIAVGIFCCGLLCKINTVLVFPSHIWNASSIFCFSWVVLLDGITMRGCTGISVHGHFMSQLIKLYILFQWRNNACNFITQKVLTLVSNDLSSLNCPFPSSLFLFFKDGEL